MREHDLDPCDGAPFAEPAGIALLIAARDAAYHDALRDGPAMDPCR